MLLRPGHRHVAGAQFLGEGSEDHRPEVLADELPRPSSRGGGELQLLGQVEHHRPVPADLPVQQHLPEVAVSSTSQKLP
ncbi:hypothetical protein ACWD4T_43035 [Streptomyces umbrinus]